MQNIQWLYKLLSGIRYIPVLVCAILLSSCGPQTETPPIRVSASYWIGYEPLFVAEGMEYFPDGSVHVIENINAVTLEQTLRGDTVDAVLVSLSRAIDYASKEQDVTIVLVLGWSNGADKLIARQGITTPKDLKGKRIGTELDTVNTYLLLRALQHYDLDLNDVELVPLANEGMEQSFADENLAAASVYGRAAIALEAQGASAIFDSSQIPGEIMDVLLVRTPFLKAYPERVADLIKGWTKATAFLNDNPNNFTPFLVEDADYKQNASLVHFATAQDNEALLSDDWQKLKEIVERRRETNALIHTKDAVQLLPQLDNRPFLSITKEVP